MADTNTLQAWNLVWERAANNALKTDIIPESPFGKTVSITAPLTLYVDVAGSDLNPGTQNAPFASIQAALDSLKGLEIAAPVNIQVGAGTFAGFYVPALTVLQPIGATSASVTLTGTISNSISGTCVTSTVDGTMVLTDASKAWTVDEHVGKLVTATVNGASPVTLNCFGNSATQLFIGINGAGYTEYTIHNMDTVLTPVNMNSNNCCILMPSGLATAQVSQLNVTRIRNAFSTTNAIIMRGGNLQLTQCTFGATSSGNVVNFFGGHLSTTTVVFTGPTSSSGNGISASSTAFGQVSLNTTAFSVMGNGISLISPSLYVGGNNTIFYKCNTGGINALWGSSLAMIGGLTKFQNCGIGVNLSNGSKLSFAIATNVCGTGNTTCFSVAKGSRCNVPSVATITGTTELNVDGTTGTIATMRATSPKVFPVSPGSAYLSQIYE